MTSPRPTRLLVRGVNWLGDAIMTTPALLRLREAHPDWRIALLTRESLADLWLDHPAVDDLIAVSQQESIWATARRLRTRQFDIALALPNSTRSALELWLARIPRRVGFGGRGRGWLLTDIVPAPPTFVRMRKASKQAIRNSVNRANEPARQRIPIPGSAHQIFHYLELVRHFQASPEPVAPAVRVAPQEVGAFVSRFIPGSHLTRPLFGLAPGAEYGPAKRWPMDRFIDVAIAVQANTNCQWLLFGGAGDVEVSARIETAINAAAKGRLHAEANAAPAAINLAGRTRLRELCAGLKACQLLLTNDTGPMHVAAALGTPVIAIFGSTSPELTGPGLPGSHFHTLLRSNVPCSPCFLRTCPIDFRCMNQITPELVIEAVLNVARCSG